MKRGMMKSEQSVRREFNRVCGLIKHKNDECKCCLEQKVYADALLWVLWKEGSIHGFRNKQNQKQTKTKLQRNGR